MPKERIRVVLSSSPEQKGDMLSRANQGLLSAAVTTDQLWDKHCVSWIEARRPEVVLGARGDHDRPSIWILPPSGPYVLAWAKLRARRVRGGFVPWAGSKLLFVAAL